MLGLISGKKDVDIYTLDYSLYKELKYCFETSETIIHCFSIMENFLFQNIKIKGAKKNLEDFIDNYIYGFFRNVLKNFWILGWCPYVIKTVKDKYTGEKQLIPEVVNLNFIHVELHVDRKNFNHKFEVYDPQTLKTRNDIKICSFFDLDDFVNVAMIKSPIRSFVNEYRYLQQMKKFSVQSEFVRSNPAIFLKSADGKSKQVNNVNEMENEQDEMELMNNDEQEIPDRIANLKEASTDIVRNVEFHNQQMEEMTSFQNSSYYNVGLNYRPQTSNNLFICPPGMELAAQPKLPETKLDINALNKKFSTTVFLTLGIPETIFGYGSNVNLSSYGRTSSRSTEIRKDMNVLDVNSFDSVLSKYHKVFRIIMIDIYLAIYKVKLKMSAVTFETPKIYNELIQHSLIKIKVDEQNEIKKAMKVMEENNESESGNKRKVEKDEKDEKPKENDKKKEETEKKEDGEPKNKKTKN